MGKPGPAWYCSWSTRLSTFIGVVLLTCPFAGSAEIAAPAASTAGSAVATRPSSPPDAEPTGLLSFSHEGGAGVELPSGEVLVCGGYAQGSSCERLDPRTLQWSLAPAMAHPRARHVLWALRDGRVLAIGGADTTEVEALGSTWTAHSKLPRAILALTAAEREDGQLWVVGIEPTARTAIAMVGDATAGTWRAVEAPLPTSYQAAGGMTDDGGLFVTNVTPREACAMMREPSRPTIAAYALNLDRETWVHRSLTPNETARFCQFIWQTPPLVGEHSLPESVKVGLHSGGALALGPAFSSSGQTVGWLLGPAARQPLPCLGLTAFVGSLTKRAAQAGALDLNGDARPRQWEALISPLCRTAVATGVAGDFTSAVQSARQQPATTFFLDYLTCTLPADTAAQVATLAQREAVIVARSPDRQETPRERDTRAKCLIALASEDQPSAAAALDRYERSTALSIGALPRARETDFWSFGQTVDPALIDAVQESSALRRRALRVLQRALDEKVVDASTLAKAVCTSPALSTTPSSSGAASSPGPGSPPVTPTTPPAAVDPLGSRVCASGLSAEAQWSASKRRKRASMTSVLASLAAAGAVTLGAVTRNDDQLRFIPVASMLAGGASLGVALGGRASCSGPLCGLRTFAEVGGGLLGGTLGLGAGWLLSSERGPPRVVATSLGAAAVLGAILTSAWTTE